MEELNIEVAKVPLVIETKGDNLQLEQDRTAKENQGPELADSISNVVEEGRHVTKKVDRFYVVKLWPNLEARIGEAEKLIKKLNQDINEFARKLEDNTRNRKALISKLEWLKNEDRYFGKSVADKREKMDFLRLALDKLCFANNAYRVRPTKSRSSEGVLVIHKGELDLLQLALEKLYSERNDYKQRAPNSFPSSHELDKHKLHFRMLHGTNNLAEEKQLLKEIYGSQQKTISSCFPLKELDDAIWWFHSNEWQALAYWPFKETTADHKEKIKREKNELVCLKEKAIANAAVKGKLWNSLGSKQVIQDQVNVIGTELNGINKNVLQVRANAKHVERELKKVENDTELVKKHLRVTRQRKDIEVSKWLGQLRELRAEEGSDYFKYQSLVENARELAQEKGVTALEELSQEQVCRFQLLHH